MGISRECAESESQSFLEAYDEMPREHQEIYGDERPDPMRQYERCFFCGQTDGDFRKAEEGDCPPGCTIQPTIWEAS